MMAHLPVLPVIIPLLTAPLMVLLGGRRLSCLLMKAAAIASFVASLWLIAPVSEAGSITYLLGGWNAPMGITYQIDGLNLPFLLLVSGIGALAALYLAAGHGREPGVSRPPLFYALFLLCLAGLLGICATNDIFNVYVFLEISSLSAYALIACGPNRRAPYSAFYYLILGTVGATFFLLGVGFLYAKTGTLNMNDLGVRIGETGLSPTILVAGAFLLAGIAMKLALFPLHLWLPGAYGDAPQGISLFLAATATKVSLYLLIRVFWDVLPEAAALRLYVPQILSCLGGTAILLGSLAAIYQNDLKRLLAFSSIAQIGYLVLGLGLNSEAGLTASALHALNHALAKAGLFAAAGLFVWRLGHSRFSDLSAVLPLSITVPFAICGISLVGLPFTAGFISKWMLLEALFEKGSIVGVVVVLAGSLLAVLYVGKVLEKLYRGGVAPPAEESGKAGAGAAVAAEKTDPVLALVVLWALALANLFFGLYPAPLLALARGAAEFAMGGGL